MNYLKKCLILALFVNLAACTTTGETWDIGNYQGEAVSTRLQDLRLSMEDGGKAPFLEVFAGFEPDEGFFIARLPLDEIDPVYVISPILPPLLAQYDANQNGFIEQPELVVLYIRETARALGHNVDYLDLDGRADAIITSPRDIGGLMNYVKKHTPAMAQQTQAHFRALDWMGHEAQIRGSEGGRDDQRFYH